MKLEAKDGTRVEIDAAHAQLSGFLRSLMEDSTDANEVLPVGMQGEHLTKIAAFLALTSSTPAPRIPKPLPSGTTTLADVVPLCYSDLLTGMTKEEVGTLAEAADYLQVDAFVSLCCARLALYAREMTPEEARAFFGVDTTK